MEHAGVETDARDGTLVFVEVVDRTLTAQRTRDVLREELALPYRVLRVRNAESADTATGEVGNGADVARAPGVVDDVLAIRNSEVGLDLQPSAIIDRQIGVLEHRARHHAGSPDDQVGVERLTGGQLDLAVNGGGQLRAEMNDRFALGQVLENPVAGLQRNLRHDPFHGLDQVEVRVVDRERRIEAQQR